MNKNTKVIVVDSVPITRYGIKGILHEQENINVALDTSSMTYAMDFLEKEDVDFLLVALYHMNEDELEVIAKAIERNIKVVLVTGMRNVNAENFKKLMKLDVSGVISMSEYSSESILKTLECIKQHGFYLSPVYHSYILDYKKTYNRVIKEGQRLEEGNSCYDYLQLDYSKAQILLTRRECDIMTCLLKGLSNPGISKELGISVKTTKNHMSNILDKLQSHDRTHAVVSVIKKGWVYGKIVK